MTTISETFNSEAYNNIFMIPLWILLVLETGMSSDKKMRKRVANQQRGYYLADMKKQRQQYERQIRAPRPQYRVTSPHF